QMALRANRVPARRVEFGRVDDFTRPGCPARSHLRDVISPRPVASLARDSAFEKGRSAEPVLDAGQWLQPAGVALQAGRLHRARQVNGPVLPITRRDVPFRSRGVVRDWGLEQK